MNEPTELSVNERPPTPEDQQTDVTTTTSQSSSEEQQPKIQDIVDDDLNAILDNFHRVHMESFEKIRHFHQKRDSSQVSLKSDLQTLLERLTEAKNCAEAIISKGN